MYLFSNLGVAVESDHADEELKESDIHRVLSNDRRWMILNFLREDQEAH